jgi:putative hydrolase of the HAD superfamily
MRDRWVVLDAKGVLYRHGQDVDDLLIPYARGRGSEASAERIRASYLEASVGEITSKELWAKVGVTSSNADEDYCELHELNPGVREFLASHGVRLVCLSNDVSEWAAILRRRFAIQGAFEDWIISGDVGIRKPDPRIYEMVSRRLGVGGDRLMFVDDRPCNLDAAAERGWFTVQFGGEPAGHRLVQGFAELESIVTHWHSS